MALLTASRGRAGLTAAALLCAALASVLGAGSPAAGDDPSEYRVKAAFLYNFAKFTEWPADAFADAGAPIVIGVLGEDPFEDDLERTVEGKTLGDRRFAIKRSREVRDLKACHILFVSASEEERLPEVFGALKGSHALTVGESPGFCKAGGVVGFFLEARKVRFEIDLDAAERARLKISSRLLSLARIVRSGRPG